jgi:hypothetical protein
VARVCTLKSTRDGGVGTVVRNTLAALSGLALFLGAATTANAFEVKKTSKGELVHWEESTVKYTIDPSVDQNVAQATDATLEAMKSWSGTVGAPDLGTLAHDDASPTKPGFDQKNGVFYMAGGYAPAGKALAITVLTYDNATGRILDADVIFNGSYAFQVLAPPGAPVIAQESSPTAAHPSTTDNVTHDDEGIAAEGTVYDLHHVVAHELGHSLGMNDELVRKDALMYRYSAPNDATMRAPATDDIEGLAELYSTQIEAHGNGCGNATVSPKAPSHTASHAAMFACRSSDDHSFRSVTLGQERIGRCAGESAQYESRGRSCEREDPLDINGDGERPLQDDVQACDCVGRYRWQHHARSRRLLRTGIR